MAPIAGLHARDPATNTFLIGRTRWVNDPAIYTARGAELGLTWNALHGLDLRASASVQRVGSLPREDDADRHRELLAMPDRWRRHRAPLLGDVAQLSPRDLQHLRDSRELLLAQKPGARVESEAAERPVSGPEG